MAKELTVILKNGSFYPHTSVDIDRIKNMKDGQILRIKAIGVRKPRSYQQLKLYFACCQLVADNCDDPNFHDRDSVDFQVRVACKFYNNDKLVVIKNKVILELRSISYENLKHIEACNFFDNAFKIMADKIGVSVETLTSEGSTQ